MNILVIEKTAGRMNELGDLLRQSGHDIRSFSGRDAGLAALLASRPDIVVVEWSPDDPTLGDIAVALREGSDATYRSLVAIVQADTSDARSAAYAAGADDVALGTASPRELADHIRSAERVVRLERRLRERVVELESALRRLALAARSRGQEVATTAAAPQRGGIGFLLTNAWTDLERLMTGMCREYLQADYQPVVGGTAPTDGRGATISLTDVENELRLELSFITSDASARAIAATICGDPSLVDDDIVRDVILELANSGMGAVKAAFLGEQFCFAGSLPKELSSFDAAKLLHGAEAKRILTFRSDGAVVHAIVSVRHQGKTRVPLSRLKEGMVLAQDLVNDGGVLLARAGTRLTETTAHRLARLMPNKIVELAEEPDAAAA